ncbi:MAG: 3-isopropylmalate dehydratase [Hyphomonadaceae bacterium]|jgi:3-isopropylmalate/(R)-2-methylmalate dehydratase small subunit|uniref:LeuD/DmdB family oxidoreductase small subunit n=1 Tax=Aquidulcibacter sp. TaxID=2052990 RepID=UPI0022CA3E9E|nr:3-isopropylmalate dehydratase [Aquidulcibacter sp.]MCE2890402.1 3-isopropylmalate dehydratase small subunit [Hyphomonadaceae bacterium]MCZ8206987.1 3-isopropylmalate dehydratase [Aquidulcibacter sp.]
MTETASMGRAFVFGDNIDTDLLAPGHLMKLSAQELAQHCLEAIAPEFATTVEIGDFVVAGNNFGLGSSREQAAVSLRQLGVGAVIAPSFARIFYRNALNLGLPALFCEDAHRIAEGDQLMVDPVLGKITNKTRGEVLSCKPIPDHLMAMVRAGGLIAHLQSRRGT